MADITHGTWIKDGKAVDTVYQGGIKVYGRNYFMDSAATRSITGNNSTNQVVYGPAFSFGDLQHIPFPVNTPVSVSADILVTGSNPSGLFRFQYGNTPWEQGKLSTVLNMEDFKINETRRIAFSDVLGPDIFLPNSTASFMRIRLDNIPTTITISVSNWKYEFSTISTPYSQAPEDVLH